MTDYLSNSVHFVKLHLRDYSVVIMYVYLLGKNDMCDDDIYVMRKSEVRILIVSW